MIEHISLHDTKFLAEEAARAYNDGYPPQGYGTQTVVTKLTDGLWQMRATRWHSCD